MRSLLLGLLVLVATPRLARADGWWKACDSDGNPGNGTDCQCSSSDPAAVGTSLGLMGLVAWRIGRKRRSR